MNTQRTSYRFAFALAAIALLSFATSPAWAKGGGGHGGGGGHRSGGGHHGGGDHHANHHPYHPSKHHADHHAADHHDHHGDHDHHHADHHDHFAHHNHHHSSWHHGDWGPGFWGGAGLGYAVGNWAPWGYGGYGYGGSYVDNSTTVTPAINDSGDADDASDDASNDGDDSDNNQSAPNTAGNENGFPTDDWPELGITTYSGQYGGSQGQVIVRIVPGSAAAKAGFVPGDVILSLNGQPTPSADALDEVLDNAKGQFTAQVWDARTGRSSTLSGPLDANTPAEGDSNATAAVLQQ